jgi:hypothetical protein
MPLIFFVYFPSFRDRELVLDGISVSGIVILQDSIIDGSSGKIWGQ